MAVDKRAAKTPAKSGRVLIDEFIAKLDHPLKAEVEAIRQIILSAHAELGEHIKWNAPSFYLDGEDMVTLNLKASGYVLLVFHRGAKVKDGVGPGPLFEDTTGLLEWRSSDRATAKFGDMDDVKSKQAKLTQLVTKWIEVTRALHQ